MPICLVNLEKFIFSITHKSLLYHIDKFFKTVIYQFPKILDLIKSKKKKQEGSRLPKCPQVFLTLMTGNSFNIEIFDLLEVMLVRNIIINNFIFKVNKQHLPESSGECFALWSLPSKRGDILSALWKKRNYKQRRNGGIRMRSNICKPKNSSLKFIM